MQRKMWKTTNKFASGNIQSDIYQYLRYVHTSTCMLSAEGTNPTTSAEQQTAPHGYPFHVPAHNPSSPLRPYSWEATPRAGRPSLGEATSPGLRSAAVLKDGESHLQKRRQALDSLPGS